jgi:hypothetical protein
MKESAEQKIKKDVKRIGLDVVIGLMIVMLLLGFIAGIVVY